MSACPNRSLAPGISPYQEGMTTSGLIADIVPPNPSERSFLSPCCPPPLPHGKKPFEIELVFLTIGELQSFGILWIPWLALILEFLLMALVLISLV